MNLDMQQTRFEFGKNWIDYAELVDEKRIDVAKRSLKQFLDVDNLADKTFLDVGSGSGLFSLAAQRLGARVVSFDFDVDSVRCTEQLKDKFAANGEWKISRGSILDDMFVDQLGKFDVVYSWGVLHHTGDMQTALSNIDRLVKQNGYLFVSIYNYQKYLTRFWIRVKRFYCESPAPAKNLLLWTYISSQASLAFMRDVVFLTNPMRRYLEKKRDRGMSYYHDWKDWLGGYPFEAAKPEEVFDLFRLRGYRLERLKTMGGGHGCNEFLFRKTS